MKTERKADLTLGGLIMSAYQISGARRAAKIVRLMFEARLVAFQTPQLSLAHYSKKRHV
jgi:hypothetical protein